MALHHVRGCDAMADVTLETVVFPFADMHNYSRKRKWLREKSGRNKTYVANLLTLVTEVYLKIYFISDYFYGMFFFVTDGANFVLKC